MKIGNTLLLSFLIFITTPSLATLITKDFLNVGDNLITLDTNTGLEWLDLSVSAGQSVNSLKAGYGGLLTNHNFSIDDNGSLHRLIDSIGWDLAGIDTLLDTLGCTICGPSSYGAIVFIKNGYSTIGWFRGERFDGDADNGPDSSYWGAGHALVRRSFSVSEPSSIIIMLLIIGAAFRISRTRV